VNSTQDAMIFAHFIEDSTINVAIEEQTINATVYPNPFKDDLHIKLDDKIVGEKTISIFDISGRLHYSNKQYVNEFSISTSSFHAGVYFIKIQTEDNRMITRKVIKK
jgi:hypothetical protein